MTEGNSMNYLIVMPQITKIKEQYYPFPIGLAYVSSSLKATGRNVVTLNLNYKEESIFDILKKFIEDGNIDVIATGGLTAQYYQIKEILEYAKKIKPTITTIVGGGIITSDAEPAMIALEVADYGVIGEGEETICELSEALENSLDLQTVDGLIYKNENIYHITNQRKEIMDLDSLPFPDYEGFEFGEVITKSPSDIYAFVEGNFAMVSFGRSCPYNCTFCFHSSGTKYRKRSLNSIFKELDILVSIYAIKNIAITDELFAVNKEYVNEFCERIRKYNIGFVVSLRVDIITKELLLMLKDSGCISVGFGLESADNSILKSMRKNITVEQIDEALTLCNEVGLNAQGNFIFGDIEETVDTANNTINWWLAHPQFQIALHFIVVYPGTYLYKYACKNGIIKDKVQFIKDGCPYVNVSKLSDVEYRELAARVDTLALTRTDYLQNATILCKAFGKVDLTGECPNCGFINTFINLDVFRPLSNVECKNCNKMMNLLVADYIDDTFENNISYLLKEHKIAIWPITNSIKAIFDASKSLNHENVFLIDSSPFKQGNNIIGKTIQSPNTIIKEKIDIVIVTVTTSIGNEIIDIIEKNYKTVNRILFVGELIKDFSI